MDIDLDDGSEAPEDDVVVMGTWTRPEAIDLLEDALPHAAHLKPLWERIVVKVEEGKALIGLPITSKVTDDTCDNHARHLYSLLKLLGLPLVRSPMALDRITTGGGGLRTLNYEPPAKEK
jgi:hypothetical protein